MKFLLLFILLFSFTLCFSQKEDIYKRKPWEDFAKKSLADAQKRSQENKMLQAYQNDPTMPVLKPKLTAKYIGPNGKGADIYAMMPYNMPCLVPDSTFHSNMPIAKEDNSKVGTDNSKVPTVKFFH